MKEHAFELLVDGVPYEVKTIPFKYNNETRYRVSYNGGEENIFVWDTQMRRMRAIDDEASDIPETLEVSIGEKLLAVAKYYKFKGIV